MASALAALKLALIRSDLSSSVTAALIRDTCWPIGPLEYQRALLRMAHMISTWHAESKSAIAQVDQLIAMARESR